MSSSVHPSGSREERIAELPTALIADAMESLGLKPAVLASSIRLVTGNRLFGRARTVQKRLLPSNADQREIAPSLASGLYDVIDGSAPGDVIVLAVEGDTSCANFGGNMAFRASMVGIRGIVTDGAIRDVQDIEELGLAAFAKATTPKTSRGSFAVTGKNEPVICGGVLIAPGDFIAGDRDGVLAIPPAALGDIVAKAEALLKRETDMRSFMRDGGSLSDAMSKFKK